jgi:acetoin:2,6-dichlorophenolindophenol oxidoreductase subunit alpha
METQDATVAAEAGWLSEAYERMLDIRLFEDKVQELFLQGLVQGTTHLCQGQEATIFGSLAALEPRDLVTVTYRGHGHALARGMSLEAGFAELMGREAGCCNGVGGSMHFTDFSLGLIGAFAIVGAGLPVAVGAAMSAKRRGTGQVAMTFFGDGSTNLGTFHESLNMAAVWKAPTVFVVENNLYGEYTPMRQTTPIDDLADRAASYGMPGVIVDGQDVEQVREVAAAAVKRARDGEGPTLIEAKTYRFRGHSRTDPAKYRPDGELDLWRERDPLTVLAERLGSLGQADAASLAALQESRQQEVDAAADRAAQSPVVSLEEAATYVYA